MDYTRAGNPSRPSCSSLRTQIVEQTSANPKRGRLASQNDVISMFVEHRVTIISLLGGYQGERGGKEPIDREGIPTTTRRTGPKLCRVDFTSSIRDGIPVPPSPCRELDLRRRHPGLSSGLSHLKGSKKAFLISVRD